MTEYVGTLNGFHRIANATGSKAVRRLLLGDLVDDTRYQMQCGSLLNSMQGSALESFEQNQTLSSSFEGQNYKEGHLEAGTPHISTPTMSH